MARAYSSSSSRGQRSVQLGARVRKKGTGGNHWYQVGAVAFLVLTLCGLILVSIAGSRFLYRSLLSENDRFRIQTIEITPGRIKTETMIREYLAYVDITAGTNLFAFNLRKLVALYLERNPLVRQMHVRRRLPGTLEVEILERDPLARLGQRGNLVADREGYVFRLSSDLHRLPVIIGDKDAELAPGRDVQGMSRVAIDVLAACDNPLMGMRLVGVDVSRTDYLRLHMLTADGIKEVKLSWEGMGRRTTTSYANMRQRLSEVRQTVEKDRAAHSEYDASILPGRVHAR